MPLSLKKTYKLKKYKKQKKQKKARATSVKARATSVKARATSVKAKKRGGKAIDAGGYGCVFSPALKCSDSIVPYDANNISKLMYKHDTKKEMDEIQKIKAVVKNIPENDKYFIVSNIYECSPDKITQEEDLNSFDKKCTLFTQDNINRQNVNDNLHRLALINMPNGGISVEKYITSLVNLPNKYSLFNKLNNALIELLKNGIIPMNKLKYNHYDVKASNVLYSSNGNARLIDWGLSGSNDGKTIPSAIKNRPITFNMPFSDIFFNSYIKQWLPEEYRKIKASLKFRDKKGGQKELLKIIAVNLINKSIEETNEGHYDYITTILLHDIYKIYASRNKYNALDFNMLSYATLIEYIEAVLTHFVDDNGNFNDIDYYYKVFVHNADIWGFIIIYAPMIEDGGDGKIHKDIIGGICRILLKYCFSAEFAIKPINTDELISDLLSLNDISKGVEPLLL
jgi:hypothetical protein